MHSIVSLVAFLFSGLSAICSYGLLKMPFSATSVILGMMDLTALVLIIDGVYLGLGAGGMERMITYPILVWMIGFGGHLMAQPERETTK